MVSSLIRHNRGGELPILNRDSILHKSAPITPVLCNPCLPIEVYGKRDSPFSRPALGLGRTWRPKSMHVSSISCKDLYDITSVIERYNTLRCQREQSSLCGYSAQASVWSKSSKMSFSSELQKSMDRAVAIIYYTRTLIHVSMVAQDSRAWSLILILLHNPNQEDEVVTLVDVNFKMMRNRPHKCQTERISIKIIILSPHPPRSKHRIQTYNSSIT